MRRGRYTEVQAIIEVSKKLIEINKILRDVEENIKEGEK
jgi:hypothetical protein